MSVPVPGSIFGLSRPWERATKIDYFSSVNLYTKNVLTTINIGDINLYHNSKDNYTGYEFGNNWSYSYNISLYVQATYVVVQHSDGRQDRHNISGSNFVSPVGIYDSIASSGSPIVSYTLTTKDQKKLRFTNPNGTGWWLYTITDLSNNTITIDRDNTNKITSITFPSKRAITFSYNASGRVSTITDYVNRQWLFNYNNNGNLQKITLPTVSASSYNYQFTYSGTTLITAIVDLKGNTWSYSYDGNGDLYKSTDAIGNTRQYVMNNASSVTIYSIPNTFSLNSGISGVDNKTTIFCIPDGTVSTAKWKVTGSAGSYLNSNAALIGNHESAIGTATGNYDTGDVSVSSSQLTDIQNSVGLPLSVVLRDYEELPGLGGPDSITSFRLTLTGSFKSYFSTPNGVMTSYTYDSSGRITQTKDSLGRAENYTYDSSNNVIKYQDFNGNFWNYTYTSSGNISTITDPLSGVCTFIYNSFNQPVSGKTQLGYVNTIAYDSSGNATKMQSLNTNGAVLYTQSYVYDNRGFCLSKIDGNNNTITYTYDTSGNLLTSTTPLGKVKSWGYDGASSVIKTTDPSGRITNYTLDEWRRITTITFPDNTTRTFKYDVYNQITSWVDEIGSWSRIYDALGRITSEKLGAITLMSNIYDGAGAAGLLTSTTNISGKVTTYTYNGLNQLASATDSSGTISCIYDNNGNITQVTLPNKGVTIYTYDTLSRLTSITHKSSGGTTLGSFTYTYNADGTIATCTEKDGWITTYTYDAGGRLTNEVRTGLDSYNKAYTVDSSSRRTSQIIDGSTTNFIYSNDGELTSTSGPINNTYTYNINGEQTNRTVGGISYTLVYDYLGNLTSITHTSGGHTYTTSFTYDAAGRRYKSNSTIDGAGNPIYYTYFRDNILQQKQDSVNGDTTYTNKKGFIRKGNTVYLSDNLSPRIFTDLSDSKVITGRTNYDAFGNTINVSGGLSGENLYCRNFNYINNSDAGLIHVGAREYDPQVGLWTRIDDVISEPAYLYCNHDPINNTDPTGNDIYNISRDLFGGSDTHTFNPEPIPIYPIKPPRYPWDPPPFTFTLPEIFPSTWFPVEPRPYPWIWTTPLGPSIHITNPIKGPSLIDRINEWLDDFLGMK